MMTNPVLVEVTRGALVESIHRGSLAVAHATGAPILALGDVTRPVYPRSAIKIVQALPLLETGAAEQFGFGDEAIALACGSHVGAPRHVAVARGMLGRLGLDESCLACGPAIPLGTKAAQVLAASGQPPTAFHHNCSGKHAGLLAAALAIGAPVEGYTDAGHAVQRHVQGALSTLTGGDLTGDVCGIDGCCVPTWAIPLDRLARLFARLATGEPELVAGPGRADTVVMAALPSRIYMKTGAEGVYCGALPELGLGFALKVDDGALRASAAAVMPLIEHLLPEARGLVKRSVLRTARGVETGAIRTSKEYERALDTLKAKAA
jgi:L-asparaginase II